MLQKPFNHSADSVYSFFSQPGRGFYVPQYQRQYAWDGENAKQLVGDIFSSVKRVLVKPDNTLFLGTIILHDEKNVTVGVHYDTPNLITRVSNVVDGQQRITSLAILACVFRDALRRLSADLKAKGASIKDFDNLSKELDDEEVFLEELFSVELKKSGVNPRHKPIIIRANDASSNPATDQWTSAGSADDYYRSNTSKVLAHAIDGCAVDRLHLDERLQGVVDAFEEGIESAIESSDSNLADLLIQANMTSGSSLEGFIDFPPDLDEMSQLGSVQKATYYSGLLMLAASKFLRAGCQFVIIECLDEGLAFDMFQSLNATGTPLTAFEVFKPRLVRDWKQRYASVIKPYVDRIEKVFDTENTANKKEEITDRVIVSTALVYDGATLARRFSEERDWLEDNSPNQSGAGSARLVSCLADQAEYYDHFVRPRKPAKNSSNFQLVDHLLKLGMSHRDAEFSALCVFYLRDAKHQMAHSVISVFYSKLLAAQSGGDVNAAASEFLNVCKATAAFFTLWMGAGRGRFPDADYRALFDADKANMSEKAGKSRQTAAFLKAKFREALARQGFYDSNDRLKARQLWVDSAKKSEWYQRKAVCRFGLFAAMHDAAPDINKGMEGFVVDGMTGSCELLSPKAWYAEEYEVIEHVAVRDQPRGQIQFKSYYDPKIYPGNYSIVDKIGNLTFLSRAANSSIYSEWPEKVFYYWSLTMPSVHATGVPANEVMKQLQLHKCPPKLASLQAASNYLPHLAPIARRGIEGKAWDADFIEKRSEQLCERIFDRLSDWLA